MTLSPQQLRHVQAALERAGEPVVGNLFASTIEGGRSNLTVMLHAGDHRWVLRMPPRTGRTPSAHDVEREYRVADALAPTAVPVARQIVMCQDESLLDAPFSVAEFVDGRAVRTHDDLLVVSDVQLTGALDSMLTALAALHEVPPDAVGLSGFGRPSGYAERQVRRWGLQWEHVGTKEHDARAAEVVRRLGASIPAQPHSRIVHGDFRIDNALIDFTSPDGPEVAAVVDWELSTLGDPVADVAMMCAYRDPTFDLIVGAPSAWTSPRLPDAEMLAQRYVNLGGCDLASWEFHLALAYFKIGVIAAGIEHRRQAGSGSGTGFDTAGEAVPRYFELALSLAQGVHA